MTTTDLYHSDADDALWNALFFLASAMQLTHKINGIKNEIA